MAADNVQDGVDTPVYSMTDGTVYSVSYSELGGHAITIQPDFGGYLYHGHLKYAPVLKAGDEVKKGDKIAALGHSGATDIYHVHLEYSKTPEMSNSLGNDEDPSFLFQKNGTLKQDQKIIP
ncbi:M23 family metallopeptidase [Streptococcus merionis]